MGIFRSKDIFQWGPIDGAPLTIHYSALPGVREIKRDFGIIWPKSVLVFQRDKMAWFNDNRELVKVGIKVVKKLIINDRLKKSILREWNVRIRKLLKLGRDISRLNLRELDIGELVKLYKIFNQVYLDYWSYGMLAEPSNFGAEELLRCSLKALPPEEREKAVRILAAPTKLSFYAREELEFLDIEKQMEPCKKEIVSGNLRRFKESRVFHQLDDHCGKYRWMLDNYLRPKNLTIKYFINLARNDFTKGLDLDKKKREIYSYLRRTKFLKRQMIKKYGLSRSVKKYADLVDEFILFQDNRKKYTLQANRFLDKFLKEFGRRFRIPWPDLKYLLPDEIIRLVKGSNFNREINQRKKLTVIVYQAGRVKILCQKSARQYYRKLFNAGEKNKREIKGMVANHGRTTGTVRIMGSAREANRVRKGDIIVTTMTTPDYIVALKKSRALVTDVGGLTCHAAIVSRELGIPCIVGTKIATKVLKDGDRVEVNANEGTVKIIT